MKRRIAIVGLAAFLASSGPALAGRCLSYDVSRIVWCDDWDNYCQGGESWPGYPPTPDNRCPTDGSASTDETFFRQHWPMAYSGPGIDSMAPIKDKPSSIWNLPFSLMYQGGYNSAQRHEWDMTAQIAARYPGYDAVNGTDDSPLVLRYWTWSPLGAGGYVNSPMYLELMLDHDRAPTDHVWASCFGYSVGPYPIVCQQELWYQAIADCPTLSTKIHSSICFGWLAQLDRDPCNLETGRRPTTYGAATFDGLKWWELRSGLFPGYGAFAHPDGGAWFWVTIKSNQYDLMLESGTAGVSTAAVPRQYTGPFNRVAIGTGAGCAVDDTTGLCTTDYLPWNYAQENPQMGWQAVYIDTPVLLDGQYVQITGACCWPDGLCSIAGRNECLDGGGTFMGADSICYDGLCCPTPFADADRDSDVDQADFAAFQLCFTGHNGGVPAGCACFNRDGDNDVDADDYAAFQACWSGPNVPWSQDLTPLCDPN